MSAGMGEGVAPAATLSGQPLSSLAPSGQILTSDPRGNARTDATRLPAGSLANRARRGELLPLTALRGFAASLVVLYHMDLGVQFARWFRLGGDTVINTIIQRGYIFTDLFFVLSGFVIALSHPATRAVPHRWAQFALRRVARIYPLHLFTLGLFVLFEIAKVALGRGNPVIYQPEFPLRLLSNATLTHIWWENKVTFNWPAWSLSAELAAYIAFPLLALGLASRARQYGLILLAGLGLLWASLTYGNTPGSLNFFHVSRGVFGFALGVGLYGLYAGRPQPGRLLRSDALLGTVILAVPLSLALDAPDLLLIPLFGLLVLAAACNQGRIGRLLATAMPVRLGDLSYSIYLMHAIMLTAFVTALELLGPRVSQPLAMAAAAAFLVSLFLVSRLTYHGIELPARSWLVRHGSAWLAPRPAG